MRYRSESARLLRAIARILVLTGVLSGACLAFALSASAQEDSAAQAHELFQAEKWSELVRLVDAVPVRSAELNYEYGLALAHLERWDEARRALLAGSRLQPRDKRFPVELAGVTFKQKNYPQAIAYLRRALRLDPHDDYSNDFLATVYFLQGNLEAALKYWNLVGQPKIAELRNDPELHVRTALLDHAITFSAESELPFGDFLASQARLRNLAVFPAYRFELLVREDGQFDSVLRAQELNGFGAGKLDAALRLFRGLPFQEINPEYYNAGGRAINILSLVRWDPDKRRLWAAVSAPLGQSPQWRLRINADLLNENWDIRNGFTGPAPVLASLNLRREEVGAQIARLVGWRWNWSLGVELSHRDYRNAVPGTALTPQLLASGYQLKQTGTIAYQLLHSPERRLTITAGAGGQAATMWSTPAQSFQKLQASLEARWFPRSRGADYETRWRLRAGRIFGQPSFDELYMLGLERDNDLWMRAHIGVRDGRKGSAPLGRNFFLSNWQTDKNLYSNGLITFKLGPFLDAGKITDPVSTLGSQKWLFDTGAQTTLRVLGVGVVFVYGKDLRTGNNAYYATIAR